MECLFMDDWNTDTEINTEVRFNELQTRAQLD